MQTVAFDVGDGFIIQRDVLQVAAAVIQIGLGLAVGQCGLQTVTVAVVLVGNSGLPSVVGNGFADDLP